MTKESPKARQKPDDVANRITHFENEADTSKHVYEKLNEDNERMNGDYNDEEYDEFHKEPPDIYPDENRGQKLKEVLRKGKEVKNKQEKPAMTNDDFDYGRSYN